MMFWNTVTKEWEHPEGTFVLVAVPGYLLLAQGGKVTHVRRTVDAP